MRADLAKTRASQATTAQTPEHLVASDGSISFLFRPRPIKGGVVKGDGGRSWPENTAACNTLTDLAAAIYARRVTWPASAPNAGHLAAASIKQSGETDYTIFDQLRAVVLGQFCLRSA